MKNTILFCFLFLFSTLSMFAQKNEKLIEIIDLRNLTDEERTKFYDSQNQAQNYDVEVNRDSIYSVSELDGGPHEGYWIYFYLVKDDTIKKHMWGLNSKEDYDKLSYYWRSDTCLYRFENSRTKEHLDMEFFPTESGSRQRITNRY